MKSVFLENNTNRKDWKIVYVNPYLINQSMINPQINKKYPPYKDKTPQDLYRINVDICIEEVCLLFYQRTPQDPYLHNKV